MYYDNFILYPEGGKFTHLLIGSFILPNIYWAVIICLTLFSVLGIQ